MTLWELVLAARDRDPAAVLVQDGEETATAAQLGAGDDADGPIVQLPQGLPLVRALFLRARGGGPIVPLHPDVRAPALSVLPDGVIAFLTSGSSGPPKLVAHAQDSLVRCALDVAGYLDIRPGDRLLGLLPLAFHYGFSQLTSAIVAGATIVLTRVSLPGELLSMIARERLTHVALVPVAFEHVVAAQEEARLALPRLRVLCCAGGGLRPALVERVSRAFPAARLHRLYGTTEALRTLHHPPDAPEEGSGVLGRPVPGVRVAVMDDDRVCAPGEEGELVHAGAFVGLGYPDAPEATAARFRPCSALGADLAVWTGDRVVRDADGCLWFRGRADALIKSGGFRVGPEEVEAALLALPGVREAVAFGVPDDVLGEAVEAAVRVEGELPSPRAMRGALPPWAVPRRLHRWEGPFPQAPNGKPLRRAVRDALRAG